MNKQEVIQEKWIETVSFPVFIIIEPHINKSNGWLNVFNLDKSTQEKIFINENIDKVTGTARPKSLHGIENNNGWLSIPEDGLPKESGDYHVIVKLFKDQGLDIFTFRKAEDPNEAQYWAETFTHYQLIKIPKQPLF